LLTQPDNKLNIDIAHDSRVIAHASSRDSTALKTLAILSLGFLLGIFVAVWTPISLNSFTQLASYLI
jgi:hypothetical protein